LVHQKNTIIDFFEQFFSSYVLKSEKNLYLILSEYLDISPCSNCPSLHTKADMHKKDIVLYMLFTYDVERVTRTLHDESDVPELPETTKVLTVNLEHGNMSEDGGIFLFSSHIPLETDKIVRMKEIQNIIPSPLPFLNTLKNYICARDDDYWSDSKFKEYSQRPHNIGNLHNSTPSYSSLPYHFDFILLH
jgi:hypothetical protein